VGYDAQQFKEVCILSGNVIIFERFEELILCINLLAQANLQFMRLKGQLEDLHYKRSIKELLCDLPALYHGSCPRD